MSLTKIIFALLLMILSIRALLAQTPSAPSPSPSPSPTTTPSVSISPTPATPTASPVPSQTATPQISVPAGEVIKRTFSSSKIFPGTTRNYSVYIPRGYDPSKPACVYIDQDGVQFNAPAVFDQLIASHEMPVTIGIFVAPGRVPALSPDALDRFNRSFEYDSLGDRYARFLLQELLPDVEKQTASDGRAIHLSRDRNDRCLAGSSSGAICAFTAAWERPKEFSRVFSSIGTYVGLRGGNEYPILIRKTEPFPLRIFLEDGSTDQNAYGGNWFLENNEMESALTFAGYEVNHAWGTGGHNAKHATEIFPDAMRWLWKDWPTPISTGLGSPQLRGILVPGETWRGAFLPPAQDMDKYENASPPSGRLYKIDTAGDKKQVVCEMKGGETKPVATGIDAPGAVTLSPDQSLLYVSDNHSRWVYSYQIQPDGSVAFGQKFYHLHVPDDEEDAGALSMCVDQDGRLYVGTRMGVQVCDQAGRVNSILRSPDGMPVNLVYFSKDDPTLLNICSAGVTANAFQRKLKVMGVIPGLAPIKPKAPHM